jgi:hypothetical protein
MTIVTHTAIQAQIRKMVILLNWLFNINPASVYYCSTVAINLILDSSGIF